MKFLPFLHSESCSHAHGLEQTLASVGSKSTYGGAATTGASWFLSSEFGVLVGLILGLSGFALNWYYSRKRDRREEMEHELRIREISGAE